MKKILIASDFDGTFSGDDDQFERDAEAVRAFRRAGGVFGLVSGRNAAALNYIHTHWNIETDFLLADNGGTCHMPSGELLFAREASEYALLPLCHYLMSKGTRLIAVNRPDGTDMIFYTHSDGRIDWAPRRAFWSARKFTEVSAYFDSVEKTHRVAREINALFPRLDALPNGGCLDIVPRGSGKDVGVGQIAALFGVEKENIYTIGDNYNDLPMIVAYGGWVVEGAPDDMKEKAPCGTVRSVEEMIGRVMRAGESDV